MEHDVRQDPLELDGWQLAIQHPRHEEVEPRDFLHAGAHSDTGNLLLMMGLPYSGKTTQAKGQPAVRVCPDEIRLALHGKRFDGRMEGLVWLMVDVFVRSSLEGGQSVVLDATMNSPKRRHPFYQLAHEVGAKVGVWHIDTPAGECRRRADAAGDTTILPVIDRQETEGVGLTQVEMELLQPESFVWRGTVMRRVLG